MTQAHKSTMPDWASLTPDLVRRIADCVLSTTGGVDSYLDMRVVCPSWRSAVARPPALTAFTDFRFRPRQWVMLDFNSEDHDDEHYLFLNVSTGHFRRLHLPVLRHYILFGATDGLLVLGDREPPHSARVLNPFTGDMVHFPALLRGHLADAMYTAVSGGAHSTLVLWGYDMVVSAAPNSEVIMEEDSSRKMTSMVTFQGNIYYAYMDGSVFNQQRDLVAQLSLDMDAHSEGDERGSSSYLVESVGELLLVHNHGIALKVFRVDVDHKLLEEVKSLGGRCALFLGGERSVSVDAGTLPSVYGDCIYMVNLVENSEYSGWSMCVYNLRDDTVEISRDYDSDRPFSLTQVVLHYCELPSCGV